MNIKQYKHNMQSLLVGIANQKSFYLKPDKSGYIKIEGLTTTNNIRFIIMKPPKLKRLDIYVWREYGDNYEIYSFDCYGVCNIKVNLL